jgi:hypothetical protein
MIIAVGTPFPFDNTESGHEALFQDLETIRTFYILHTNAEPASLAVRSAC